jgi:hypothetical protein
LQFSQKASLAAFALVLHARYNEASLRTRQIRPVNERGYMASRAVWRFAYSSYVNRAQILARTRNILEELEKNTVNI